MCRLNASDTKLLNKLMASLYMYNIRTRATIDHKPNTKTTGSLYRFGLFYINGYKYSVSGWKFKDDIVTFENEDTGEKFKFSIVEADVIYDKDFKKDGFFEKYVKLIRKKISNTLKDLSDKLQP